MIAVVHGPIGCGKSTALWGWMERRGWTGGQLRGWRTFFAGRELRLASWNGRIDVAVSVGGGCHGRGESFDPACGSRLDGFLDDVFERRGEDGVRVFGSSGCGSKPRLHSAVLPPPPVPSTPRPHSGSRLPPGGPPLPEGGECSRTLHFPNTALPWKLDAGRFWKAAVECLGGDSGLPLVIDELGVLETMPGGLDLAALDDVVSAIKGAREAILVVQERALPFWQRWLGFP